jgi:spore coat polysaccharide biosynthesis protein SpsF
MSVLIVVQARTGSSRFPRKVLADVAGQPMLGLMLERIAPLADQPATTVVVATSQAASDDEVEAIATAKGMAVVRGSEPDVLARFRQALAEHPADAVVRLTADCPLMDPAVVVAAVELHHESGADYTSNTLARTFPDGLDVEVMSAEALRWAHDHAVAPDEREHVTPHILRHPRRFLIAQLSNQAQAGEERWTVDRPEDLDIVRAAIGAGSDRAAGWPDLLQRLGRRSRADVRARPVGAPAHRRGGPYHRRWEVTDPQGLAGSGLVVVEDGGQASLETEGPRRSTVESAIRDRLQADLQVTELSPEAAGPEG